MPATELCWKCKEMRKGVILYGDDRCCPACIEENDRQLAAMRQNKQSAGVEEVGGNPPVQPVPGPSHLVRSCIENTDRQQMQSKLRQTSARLQRNANPSPPVNTKAKGGRPAVVPPQPSSSSSSAARAVGTPPGASSTGRPAHLLAQPPTVNSRMNGDRFAVVPPSSSPIALLAASHSPSLIPSPHFTTRTALTANSASNEKIEKMEEIISSLIAKVNKQSDIIAQLTSKLESVMNIVGVSVVNTISCPTSDDTASASDALPLRSDTNGATTVNVAPPTPQQPQSDVIGLIAAVYTDQQQEARRASSFIVHGLPVSKNRTDSDTVAELCDKEFSIRPEIVRCRRLGRAVESGKQQPVLVCLRDTDSAQQIIKLAKHLRQSDDVNTRKNIFINPNLTKARAQAEYQERQRRRRMRESRNNDNQHQVEIDTNSEVISSVNTAITVNTEIRTESDTVLPTGPCEGPSTAQTDTNTDGSNTAANQSNHQDHLDSGMP